MDEISSIIPLPIANNVQNTQTKLIQNKLISLQYIIKLHFNTKNGPLMKKFLIDNIVFNNANLALCQTNTRVQLQKKILKTSLQKNESAKKRKTKN